MSEPKCFYKIRQKLQILHEAYATPFNIRRMAKKYGVTPKTIRNWSETKDSLEKAHNKSKYTIHPGPSVKGESHIPIVLSELREAEHLCLPISYTNISRIYHPTTTSNFLSK
jgi:transposase-like protein